MKMKKMKEENAEMLKMEIQNSERRIVQRVEKETKRWQQLYQAEESERRRLHNKVLDLQGNIRVFCRVRPPLPIELQNNEKGHSDIIVGFMKEKDQHMTLEYSRRGSHYPEIMEYKFDKVFKPSSTQIDVYNEVQPYILSCMDGYNVSVFACK